MIHSDIYPLFFPEGTEDLLAVYTDPPAIPIPMWETPTTFSTHQTQNFSTLLCPLHLHLHLDLPAGGLTKPKPSHQYQETLECVHWQLDKLEQSLAAAVARMTSRQRDHELLSQVPQKKVLALVEV